MALEGGFNNPGNPGRGSTFSGDPRAKLQIFFYGGVLTILSENFCLQFFYFQIFLPEKFSSRAAKAHVKNLNYYF